MRDRILLLCPTDVTKDILEGKARLEMKKSAGFIYLKEMMGQFNPWFARMKWEVIKAEDGRHLLQLTVLCLSGMRHVSPLQKRVLGSLEQSCCFH